MTLCLLLAAVAGPAVLDQAAAAALSGIPLVGFRAASHGAYSALLMVLSSTVSGI